MQLEIVTLTGKTQHGKNRVAQYGAQYSVVEQRGARLLLRSLQPAKHGHDLRWVRITDDPNFRIERGSSHNS